MTDSKTATERLRELLDERGVKYDAKALRETEWTVNGVIWHANEYDGNLNVFVRNNDMLLTPEQAIAATLGVDASAARLAERLRGIADEMRNVGASSMKPHELLAFYASEVDKVADLLKFAATLGSGECEVVNHGSPYDGGVPLLQCSICDGLFYGDAKGDVPNYCPNCGKAVKR